MRFEPVKTSEQQAALMLVGVRDRLIGNRTQLANAIRGYAAGFGMTVPTGLGHLATLPDRIEVDQTLSVLACELFESHAKEYSQMRAQIAEVDAKLLTWHRADECRRRLAKIPTPPPNP
jgi:transposase